MQLLSLTRRKKTSDDYFFCAPPLLWKAGRGARGGAGCCCCWVQKKRERLHAAMKSEDDTENARKTALVLTPCTDQSGWAPAQTAARRPRTSGGRSHTARSARAPRPRRRRLPRGNPRSTRRRGGTTRAVSAARRSCGPGGPGGRGAGRRQERRTPQLQRAATTRLPGAELG